MVTHLSEAYWWLLVTYRLHPTRAIRLFKTEAANLIEIMASISVYEIESSHH